MSPSGCCSSHDEAAASRAARTGSTTASQIPLAHEATAARGVIENGIGIAAVIARPQASAKTSRRLITPGRDWPTSAAYSACPSPSSPVSFGPVGW